MRPNQAERKKFATSWKQARSECQEKKLSLSALLSKVEKDKTKYKADGTAKTCNVFPLYISKRPKNSPLAGIAGAIRLVKINRIFSCPISITLGFIFYSISPDFTAVSPRRPCITESIFQTPPSLPASPFPSWAYWYGGKFVPPPYKHL